MLDRRHLTGALAGLSLAGLSLTLPATAFAQDKKEDAEEWLSSAAKIYPKELNDVYQDSLVEVGWLQTLQ